jgi:hypothetical protein
MTMTYVTYDRPTGYSDDNFNWISKTTYIALYCLPQMTPAIRKAFDMMVDGYTLWCDGRTKKYTLRRGDEIVPLRMSVADNIPPHVLESHSEKKERGPEDIYGRRKVYTTYAWRLNHEAKEAAERE